MSKEKLKKTLGSSYQYRQRLTSDEVRQLQKENPSWVTNQTAASLIAGYVRLDAVLYREGNELRLAYDLFVKDHPNATEWVCYDNPEETVCLNEDGMCDVLDRLVQGHGLSYTECFFPCLEGKTIKKHPLDMKLDRR